MHLLGRSIRIEANPGTPRARVVLDIPRWDFHWQGAFHLVQPIRLAAGDILRVTCRFDPSLRGRDGAPRAERYVTWGEGTADEMCLGVIQVTD
jgi:hypothetical protein